jgi:hypothetical protein
MNADEFIVSFKAAEVTIGPNAGKWHTWFSIKRGGKIVYFGSSRGFSESKDVADKAAAAGLAEFFLTALCCSSKLSASLRV